MAARRGTALLIQRGDGEVSETFTTVASIRNASIAMNGESIDVTTVDDVDANDEIWRARITGVKDFTITGDGLAKSVSAVAGIDSDYRLGTITNYRVVVPYVGAYVMPAIVPNMQHDGPYDGAAAFSFTIESAGAPTFTPEEVPAVPVISVLPAVVGTPQVGVELVASAGVWTNSPTAFSYQWQVNSGSWTDISGATANAYTPVVGQVGNPIRVQVTASNSAGAGTEASSGPSADVLAA